MLISYWSNMFKNIKIVTFVLLLPAALVVAENDALGKPEPKMVKGMSIVGNDESPKSLYIVPWKSRDGRGDVRLSSDIMKEALEPVDKIEFIREINYYNSSNSASTAVSN